MGLTTTLSNALSGLAVTQNSLDVVSRNVANSGTAGYHQQTINVIDQTGTSSNFAISTQLNRAFDQALQNYYTSETSDGAQSSVNASYLNQLQTYLGMPGDANSLDTQFSNFQTALSTLTANPDDYSTRATVVSSAQSLASTLNNLTGSIQQLRQQANGQIQTDVTSVNQDLTSLNKINGQLGNLSIDSASRAALEDQRDRLVAQVASAVDVNVTYQNDGSVSLATRSGVTLLDPKGASTFNFTSDTNITATSQYSSDDSQNGVGTLTMTTPGGYTVDLVKQNVLQSGEIAGLLNLRDNTLVQAQSQLDEIAGSLAQAFSTNETDGTAVTDGSGNTIGQSVDTSSVQPGNTVNLSFTVNGTEQNVKVVDVSDSSKLPMNYVDTDGTRVVGADFSAGASSVASTLQAALGSTNLTISGSGSSLSVVAANANTTVNTLKTLTTSTATQDGSLGLSLFVDGNGGSYTGSLDGKGQMLGFAGRIAVNPDVAANNNLLVQDTTTTPIGDVARVNYLYDQLNSKTFNYPSTSGTASGGGLSGTVSDIISQALDYQGGVVSSAQSDSSSHSDAMNALQSRMTTEYGVDINAQMAQLVQLQAAYSANAHVVTVAQNLVDTLMQAVANI